MALKKTPPFHLSFLKTIKMQLMLSQPNPSILDKNIKIGWLDLKLEENYLEKKMTISYLFLYDWATVESGVNL